MKENTVQLIKVVGKSNEIKLAIKPYKQFCV